MWRIFGKRQSDAELEEELSAHLAIEVKQLMDSGMVREAADLEARRRFGNRAATLEAARAVRGFGAMKRLGEDVRYAARVLRRAPAFTAAAALSLALGIGAATAVLSIADTVLLRPLPYPHPEQLTWVGVRFPTAGGETEFVPSPDFVAWRRDNRVFQSLAAMQASIGGTAVLGGPEPVEAHIVRVSENFLATLGVRPAMGRDFLPFEERPNESPSVILTDGFWRNQLHARREVVGHTIVLDGQPVYVAGVLPPAFLFPADARIDILTTLRVNPAATHRDRSISAWGVIGRLKPGVTMDQARANITELYDGSKADFPQMFRGRTLVVKPLREHRAGNVRTLLFVLLAAAACLLAIACANVANLLLARWAARSRELAVRAAIGAGRGRMARQLFLEIAALVAAAGAAAMLFVTVALRVFVRFAGNELPRMGEVSADYRVFAAALAVCLATALAFGALPLLRVGRIDLLVVLQQTGRGYAGGGSRWMRRALIAGEIALSVVLLSGAALLAETLWHMRNDHLGFEPEHLVAVSVPAPGPQLGQVATDVIAADLIGYLNRIPGTEAASRSQCTPIRGGSGLGTFSRADRPMPEPFHRGDGILLCGTDREYAKAAALHMLQGRFFTEQDFAHPGTAAVINESAARAYFPGESPLGKQILGQQRIWKTVVGVMADSRNQGLNAAPYPQVLINDPDWNGIADLQFLVRTLAGADQVSTGLRDALRAAYPSMFFIVRVETLDGLMEEMSAGPRFNAILVSAFAAIALLMAVVGVYGVLAFSVAQRRREIGIRMALGASPGAVLTRVMRESAVLVAIGAAIGVAGSLALNRYLASLLFGVTAGDWLTHAAVVIGLALAAGAASLTPARRAATVDPAVALREE